MTTQKGARHRKQTPDGEHTQQREPAAESMPCRERVVPSSVTSTIGTGARDCMCSMTQANAQPEWNALRLRIELKHSIAHCSAGSSRTHVHHLALAFDARLTTQTGASTVSKRRTVSKHNSENSPLKACRVGSEGSHQARPPQSEPAPAIARAR
jgi:hypothetical protein